MSSGCPVSSECITNFQKFKMGTGGFDCDGLIFKFSEGFKEIIVDSIVPKGKSLQDFVDDLPEDECRYAVFNFQYQTEDGGKRNKIIFILWAASKSSIKSKMVLAASRESIRRRLDGIATEIQAGNKSELSREIIFEKVTRK